MKKRFWVTLLALVMITFLMVSCVQKGPAAPEDPDPTTFTTTPGEGEVLLDWADVPGATIYDIVINLVQPTGEREEQTQWTGTSPISEYNFNVTIAGTYTWTVAARNDAGTSGAVAGPQFVGTPVVVPEYDDPVVEITDPAADNDVVNELTPTITWTATPGELLEADNRGDTIDSCDVVITKDGAEVESGEGELVAGNAWKYEVETALEYGQTYTVEVTAHQEDNSATDDRIFKTPAELELTITPTSTYACGDIIATVKANNPDINKIAIFGKLPVEVDFRKLTPEGNNWREPDEDTRMATFTLSATELGVGVWTINAQAIGNAAESQDKTIDIKEITLIPNLSAQICGHELEDGDYVCYEPENGPVTAVYSVNIDFIDENMARYFEEIAYTFTFHGSDTTIITSDVFTYETYEASQISVSIATECYKSALLTVRATTTCGSTLTKVDFLNFILDGNPPTATILGPVFDEATKTAVITYTATDTKPFDPPTITFFVEKVDANGVQMPGWQEVEMPFGYLEPTIIGTGENKIVVETTYTATYYFEDYFSFYATATLSLGELDGATLSSDIILQEPCNYCCCDACGGPGVREPVRAKGEPTFFDNIFYQVEIENVSFVEEGDNWLLTSLSNPASATFACRDVNLHFSGVEPTQTGASIINYEIGWYTATPVIAECTGYPTKSVVEGYFILNTLFATETDLYISVQATDVQGNTKEASHLILVDTMPPTLTVVNGLKRYQGPGNDALQFSFREADTGQGIKCLGATVTILSGGSFSSGVRGYISEEKEYPPEYYDNTNEDVIIRVNGNESKTWIIDPLFRNGALDGQGEVRLEVLAQDKYGNKKVSEMTGKVIDYSHQR